MRSCVERSDTMTAILKRLILAPALAVTVAVLLVPASVAAQPVRTRYTDAQAREEAVRAAIDGIADGATAPAEC